MSPLVLTGRERRSLRRVLTLLDVDRRSFALAVLLGSLGLGAAVALGATSAWLIARASQHPPVLHLTVAAVAVRLFGISRALMRYLQRLASHRVALAGMDSLRLHLYDLLAEAPVDRVAGLRSGDILARTGSDVDDVGDLVVKSLLPACVATIVGAGTVLGISIASPAVGLLLAALLLVSGLVTPLLTMRATRLAEEAGSRARTELSAEVMTVMEGAAELQVSGRIDQVHRGLAATEDALTAATARSARVAGLAAGIDRIAMGCAVLAALLLGIPQTTSGLVAAVTLAVLVLTPLSAFEGTAELAPAAAQLVRSAGAAVRICDLLGDEEPAEATRPDVSPIVPTTTDRSADETGTVTRTPQRAVGHPVLEARDLAVGWPGGPVLATGISLTLTPGMRLALVGPSGIGKTTLLLTLAGLLPPKSGTLTLDGRAPWGTPREEVTRTVTMTAEDAHVFATSVLENLRVARADLTEDEALALLDRVGLGEWSAHLPSGLDTLIGSGGTTVSGGERRRLLMARALASPAPLLLLDEASEHLDTRTADSLMDTLLGVADTDQSEERGLLLVTHRLTGLDAADRVLVLDRPDTSGPARIVDSGTHTELLARRESYRWALDREHTVGTD